jgi:hypothetical protein
MRGTWTLVLPSLWCAFAGQRAFAAERPPVKVEILTGEDDEDFFEESAPEDADEAEAPKPKKTRKHRADNQNINTNVLNVVVESDRPPPPPPVPAAKAAHERPITAEADCDDGWGWWRPRLPGVVEDAILVSLTAARVGGDNYRGASREYLLSDYFGLRLTALFDPDSDPTVTTRAAAPGGGPSWPVAGSGPATTHFQHIEQLGFTLHPHPMHAFDFWLAAGVAHFGVLEETGLQQGFGPKADALFASRFPAGDVYLHFGAGARWFFHRFFVGAEASVDPVHVFHWEAGDGSSYDKGPTGSHFIGSLELGFRF